ncbi:unnamed protein product [Arctia plantaginis]|uniref:Uncharacterized protein n=1 Tax=Arctia plantaginis TaxID=874455 RepID=A0A8S1BIU1_ARCPL|nr:unnamed protein product [Arctia plantaginis]
MASGGSVPRSIKPCVSAPACSTHKCRHKPDPCPNPEKCFQKSKKKTVRCPSAMAVVTPRGLDCSCTPEFNNKLFYTKEAFATIENRRSTERNIPCDPA